MSRALRALALVILPVPLAAQEPTDTVALNPVVVTATRIPTPADGVPVAVTVIRGTELRERGILTVAEALRGVPAASVVTTNSFGSQTSLRNVPIDRLRDTIDPTAAGLTVLPVRAQGLEAARGATDFGEYFTYFSFFLVVSALMLAGLFFKLGIEQRSKEIGILRTLGFGPRQIRRLYFRQSMALSGVGGRPPALYRAAAGGDRLGGRLARAAHRARRGRERLRLCRGRRVPARRAARR